MPRSAQCHFQNGAHSFSYELTRKTVKNINLRIRRDGSIHVSAPAFVSKDQIDTFLLRETPFIIKTLAQIEKKPAFRLNTGDVLYIHGRPLTLCVIPGPVGKVYERGDFLYMEMPHGDEESQRARLYHQYLRQQAGPLFTASIARIYPRLQPYGVPLPTVTLRRMRSRWGSCTPARKRISLNTYLAVMPDGCIDQVVLHELCHFLECNHSSRFYGWMSRFMPDWKAWRQELVRYAPYCNI